MTRIPTIHPTGTSADQLVAAHRDAAEALLGLAVKLRACAPREVDYAPQGPTAYQHALNEHAARLAALDRVRIDLLEILEGLQSQLDGPGFGAAMLIAADRLVRP